MANLEVKHDPPLKNCRDCLAEFDHCQRPAPYAGPRCRTHALAKRNADRRKRHRSVVEEKYNLPAGGYDSLYEFQGGRCAICRRATGKTRNLAVDHSHKHCDDCKGNTSCGKGIRGLLCMRCNSLLAHIRDDLETARRVFEYLSNPPFLAWSYEQALYEKERQDWVSADDLPAQGKDLSDFLKSPASGGIAVPHWYAEEIYKLQAMLGIEHEDQG